MNFTDADTSKELHKHLRNYSDNDCKESRKSTRLTDLQVTNSQLKAKSIEALEGSKHFMMFKKRQATMAHTGMGS